jgi:hypothetical protein
VKEESTPVQGRTQTELWDSMEQILKEFSSDALKFGFPRWMSPPQQVIDRNGDHVQLPKQQHPAFYLNFHTAREDG